MMYMILMTEMFLSRFILEDADDLFVKKALLSLIVLLCSDDVLFSSSS